MGVRREFQCSGHGVVFETDDPHPRCPVAGCKTVTRVFTKAPGYVSQGTRSRDVMTRAMVQKMGLSDVSNAHGRTVAENERMKNWASAPAPDMRARTIPIEQAQGMLAQQGNSDFSSAIGGSVRPMRTHAYTDPRGDPKL